MELQYNQTENKEVLMKNRKATKAYSDGFSIQQEIWKWIELTAVSRSTIQPTTNKIKVGKPQAKVLLIPKAP